MDTGVRIHHNPAYPWTVERLAAEVAMSRSGFAARFSALVGEAPLQYLTRWRMRTAANLLQAGARAWARSRRLRVRDRV